ncbi:MAG: cyclic nucleotide-binding domain-containing protein [Desulfamplus sp.]|nr:cyclic nucleotide-binding domain-containing protein [Desulfamplus sp.]
MARIITVTSGKGGVGKTNISANLALHLAELGYNTCLFDADLGLANINILLKIYPEHNLKDVILYQKDIKEILIENYEGIDIIPGSSGVEEMANLTPDQIVKLIRQFSKLDAYDYFIIDTAAGISKDVISFCLASSELMVIITPDPTSLTDAYSLLKILTLNGFTNSVMVVVNQAPTIQSAKNALGKFVATTSKYLGLKLIPIGVIGRDQNVVSAVSRQKPFIMLYPNTSASKSIKNIAQNLIRKEVEGVVNFTMESFWEKCLNFFARTLTTGVKKPSNSQTFLSEVEPDPLVAKPSESATQQKSNLSEIPEESSLPQLPEITLPTLPDIAIPQLPEKPLSESQNRNFDVNESKDQLAKEAPIKENSPSTPDTTQLIFQTNQLLTQVAQSIASVANELKEIRELFAKSQSRSEDWENPPAYIEKESKINTPQKDMNQLTSLLSTYSMFQPLEDNEIKSIVERLKLKEYQPEEVVIKKGEPGKNLFIIISGKVEVIDDQGVVLDTMGGEDVFGEMSLMSGEPVNATIKVVETAKLLYLNGKEFLSMLRIYPALQMYFARLLTKRLSNRLKKADIATSEYLQSGLTGSISDTNITELLQMLNMGQKTGMISFRFPDGNATISFHNGEIVSSQYKQDSDKEAFYKILRETEGRFTYTSALPPRDRHKQAIGHFMKLLMEGISFIDEQS